MEIIKKRISELTSPDYNPRKISKEVMEKLKKSIKEFGYIEPIIWNKRTNNIVGGNQRFKALVEMGEKEVEVVVIDLPIEKEKTLNIALNKITGEWDDDKLAEMLKSLETEINIELTGFDELDIKRLEHIVIPNEPEITEFNLKNKCPKCGYSW